jgi:glycerophosphoryl diester phosphodiesterase
MREEEEAPIYATIQRTGGFPVVGAHRGGLGEFAPENTMLAYERSVQHGMRLLEIDVHYTRDHELVLMHWADVSVTTDGSGRIEDFMLTELRRLDAGHRDPVWRGKGVRVPTLREFLDRFVPVPDLLFMLDFKDEYALRLTLEFIAPYNIQDRIFFGCVLQHPNGVMRDIAHHGSPLDTDGRPLYRHVPVCTNIAQTLLICWTTTTLNTTSTASFCSH